jgi:Na+:H+ antiporter, NhaA family
MAGNQRTSSGQLTLTRALRAFLATEVAGGIVLVAAAAAALVWANSPWDQAYHELWDTELSVALGRWELALDLREWVAEGLMAIFFVVVALEVKRELLEGELRDRRRAALPVIAALGGMIVPAAIYLGLNSGGAGQRGWGIPMATDIAFALGVAALVGRGLPSSLRLFLLTLAIVDDIGAILVIAVFYSEGISWPWIAVAVLILAMAYMVRRTGIVYPPMFISFGVLLWLAVHESGLHATLAGVAMGLLAPARPTLEREIVLSRQDELLDVFSPEAARTTSRLARLAVSPMEWLEHALHPMDEPGHRPVVRARQRRDTSISVECRRRRDLPRDLGRAHRPGRRQDSRYLRLCMAGLPPANRVTAGRRQLDPTHRHGGARRHRLHCLALCDRTRLR